ncbi:MAG: hypothetical protein WA989_02050 [Henriciella sp.]|uniref:hypothetical protein n=1 Tax=Henriciella sp. TaxID=1968823 RepID=UPI003C77E23B
MRTLRRRHLASLKMLFAIALAAMVVRAMVPAGWMIMADPVTGQPSIQLCSGKMTVASPVAATSVYAHGDHHGHDMQGDAHDGRAMDLGEQTKAPPDQGDHDHDLTEVPCPFALSSVLGLAGEGLPSLDPHVPAAPDRAVPPVRGPPAARIIQAPLPARGPPSPI